MQRLLVAAIRAGLVGGVTGVLAAGLLGLVFPATVQGGWTNTLVLAAVGGFVAGALQVLVAALLDRIWRWP